MSGARILIEEKTSASKPYINRKTEAIRMKAPKAIVAIACVHLDNLLPTPYALYPMDLPALFFYIITMISLQ
jgi:hypothetical protein